MVSGCDGGSDHQPDELGSLIAAAAEGENWAWDALVTRFAPLVWSVARANGLGAADAADVSQVVWCRLVENLGQIREPAAVGAWLATVARRECIRVGRKTGRESSYAPDCLAEVIEPERSNRASDVELRLLVDERDAVLWRAVDRLHGNCGAILRLLMTDPRPSYEEIAAALNMAVGSIGPTRRRCLEKLRHVLAACGISDDDDLLLRTSGKGEPR